MGMVSIVFVIIIFSDGLTQKSRSEDQPTINSASFACVEDLKPLLKPLEQKSNKDAAIKLFGEKIFPVPDKELNDLEIKGLIDEIKKHPRDSSIYGEVGKSSSNSPNIYSYTMARCAYGVAVILEPNNADFLFHLGEATRLDMMNEPYSRLQDSIEFYNKSASLLEQDKKSFDTSIVDVYARLGYAYEKLSEVTKNPILLESAIGYYDKAVSYSNERNKRRYLELKDKVTATLQIKKGGVDKSPLPSNSEEPLLDYLRATVLISVQKTCQKNRQDNQTSCPEPKERGVGSGWVFKREGTKLLIVTNDHVINSDSTPVAEISVEFYSKSPYKDRPAYLAKLRHRKESNSGEDLDLAVLEVENAPNDIKPLAFYEGKYIPRLTTVTIIGNPPIPLGYGENMADYGEWTTILGSVTNTINSNSGSCSPYLPIDALALPGNSGGPVLNEKNQVIGMITKRDSGSEDSRLVVVALTGCSIKKQLELWKFSP
jgi:S1-C subfamily serine protease